MKTNYKKAIGLILCSPLLVALTGCVGYVDRPHDYVYTEPAPAYVQPEYVYYPAYQVYYNAPSHQFIYLQGHSWVTRPAPPHVSVDVLFASPSVQLGFHDHPSHHHAEIVRQYPQHWAPTGHGPDYRYRY